MATKKKPVQKSALPKIFIRDKVYIPTASLDVGDLKEQYTIKMYAEPQCRGCEYLDERHGFMCETCEHYKGETKLYSIRTIAGSNYMGLPIGDKNRLERAAKIDYTEFSIVDRRTIAPFEYPVKLTIQLREHQEKLVEDFLANPYGLIEAPPRSGKTLTVIAIAIKLGLRLCFMANQHEFLQQFLWHIEGNEAEGIPKCTNIPELEKKHKRKLFGFPKTKEDYENFQFMAITYQSLMSDDRGAERLKWINQNFGIVGIDEVHKSGAAQFSRVVSKVYTRYRFGVSGTVERKDGKHKIIKKILGPVVASTQVEAAVPKVFVHETGIKFRSVPKQWTYANLNLAANTKRNNFIVAKIMEDVKAKHSVVVPLIFKKHILEICRLVNEAAGRPIAKAYMGGGGNKNKDVRREILSDAKSGKVKVVVGIRSLMQLGLNVPKWSSIHVCMPISNSPNLKQETSRVRTPYPGKPQPIVRLYYDEGMGLSIGCAKSSAGHMKSFGYEFSTDKETVKHLDYFNSQGRGRRGFDEDAEFKPVALIEDDAEPGLAQFGRKKK